MGVVKIKLKKDFDNNGHIVKAGEVVEILSMHLDKYVDSGLADLVTKESKPKIKKEAKVVKETKELKIDSKETKDATD
tara:strand:+ start:110 stop:343 length:234 start_codon:yes stop_codon:yes gene_type:complete